MTTEKRRLPRSRDEKGRFLREEEQLPEESPLISAREIKLVKIKDTHGSYFVRTKRLTEGEKECLLIFGLLGLLAIVF